MLRSAVNDVAMSDPDITTTVQDAQGSYSSRRVAAFVALGFYILFGGACLFWLKFSETFATAYFNGLMVIITGGLLLATADRFAPKQ